MMVTTAILCYVQPNIHKFPPPTFEKREGLSVTLPIHQKKEKNALHDLYVRLW